jgi:hypothetical protein
LLKWIHTVVEFQVEQTHLQDPLKTQSNHYEAQSS